MKAIINKEHEKAFILGIEAFKKGIETPAMDKECIYANDQFGTRVCGLECLPVQLEKCKNCKERAERKDVK